MDWLLGYLMKFGLSAPGQRQSIVSHIYLRPIQKKKSATLTWPSPSNSTSPWGIGIAVDRNATTQQAHHTYQYIHAYVCPCNRIASNSTHHSNRQDSNHAPNDGVHVRGAYPQQRRGARAQRAHTHSEDHTLPYAQHGIKTIQSDSIATHERMKET